ncbi:unnamed protein product [Lota lota]
MPEAGEAVTRSQSPEPRVQSSPWSSSPTAARLNLMFRWIRGLGAVTETSPKMSGGGGEAVAAAARRLDANENQSRGRSARQLLGPFKPLAPSRAVKLGVFHLMMDVRALLAYDLLVKRGRPGSWKADANIYKARTGTGDGGASTGDLHMLFIPCRSCA